MFQTELNLESGKAHKVVETQRQLASCPVLFAWDGEGFQFVSDVLGVGGIGFNVGKGSYAPPRPWEFFMLPQGLLKAKGEQLLLKIGEPMEESSYLDHVRLLAYDLPKSWHMTLDERMGVSEPMPTGRPIFYRSEVQPISARNERGEDMLASIQEADLKAADPGPTDKRFLGLLTQEHILTLGFAKSITEGPGKAVLKIDGWVEYPYSQTCFAAWQAGLTYDAPSLEARVGEGKWQRVYTKFGYPAGMPRQMTLPLDVLPKGTTELRLRTNQEIFWDRIAVIYEEANPGVTPHVLDLEQATLAMEGFAKRTTGPQMQPHYDDSNRVPLWDTRHQSGFYTSFGDITPLLTQRDDAVAVYGPGEAVTLAFPVAPEPEQNTQRVYVLDSAGWCKDMDLYTKTGETVGPLPTVLPQSPEQRSQLHERFHTRYR